jgi:hypothetical protein
MTQHAPLPHWPFMESEGLRDLPITHLVVGDPRALVLGRRAALQSMTSADAFMASSKPVRRPLLLAAARWPRSWQVLAAGATLVLVAGVLLANSVPQVASGAPRGLPVDPASASAPAVHVVAADYVAVPPAASLAALPAVGLAVLPSVSLAVPPATHPRWASIPRVAPRPPVPTAAAPKLRAVAQKPAASEPAPRPALVLDAAAEQAQHASVAESADAASVVPIRQSAALVRASVRAAVPKSTRGLIAITPDNQLAVFTNSRTGLPQQFHVGDSLPGGDLIRAIDGQQGKVITSAGEYRLD